MVEEDVARVVHESNLYPQIMEMFLLFTEGDRHGEEILELPNQAVEQDNNFHQHLTVLIYFRTFRLLIQIVQHKQF